MNQETASIIDNKEKKAENYPKGEGAVPTDKEKQAVCKEEKGENQGQGIHIPPEIMAFVESQGISHQEAMAFVQQQGLSTDEIVSLFQNFGGNVEEECACGGHEASQVVQPHSESGSAQGAPGHEGCSSCSEKSNNIQEVHTGPAPQPGHQIPGMHTGPAPQPGHQIPGMHAGPAPQPGYQIPGMHAGPAPQPGHQIPGMHTGPAPQPGHQIPGMHTGPAPQPGHQIPGMHTGPAPQPGQMPGNPGYAPAGMNFAGHYAPQSAYYNPYGHVPGHVPGSCGGNPHHPKHDQHQYGQLMGLVSDFANGTPDVYRVMNFLETCDTQFWKGAVIGVAVTLLMTNHTVKNAIFGTMSSVVDTFRKEQTNNQKETS